MNIYNLIEGVAHKLLIIPGFQVCQYRVETARFIRYLAQYVDKGFPDSCCCIELQFAQQRQYVLRMSSAPEFDAVTNLASDFLVGMV